MVARSKLIGMTGDEAVAQAAKICDVDVVAAYPITPQTIIVEAFSNYVASGEIKTEYVCVESEHSAMSASVGASLAGARVFTATSSQGLALMHEILYIASGSRCPIVMAVANRALSSPINIHGDHSDSMGSRDSGWVQLYCENAQEAYDTTIMAFRIAEGINMPVMVNLDGFITSHCMEGVSTIDESAVAKFLPVKKLNGWLLGEHETLSMGALCLPDYYFEFKKQQEDAMHAALPAFEKTSVEFAKTSGRSYKAVETSGEGDAAIICMSSTAGTIRTMVRDSGEKLRVIKLRLYRPFPARQLKEALKGVKSVTVLDRACSFGAPTGPLGSDVKSVLYGMPESTRPAIRNIVYGLGGRDLNPTELSEIFAEAHRAAKSGKFAVESGFVGARE